MTGPSETLQQALHQKARALLTQLHPLAAQAPGELQSTWAEHLDRLEQLAQFLVGGASTPLALPAERAVSKSQWAEFGRLLRDKRTAAGLSRVQLARRAKLSDCTVKFGETARHPPSRATLIRLIGVAELKLRWADVPGHPALPAAERSEPPQSDDAGSLASLNCLLAPSYDPISLLADLAQFLQGAGGYLEQTSAYLDPGSASDYLALCQNSLPWTALRSRLPLGEVAQQIVAASGRGPLQVLALGAGDGHSETQLVVHLLDAGASRVELCLLDVNQPLLTSAYHYAVDRLALQPRVQVWALQGNFHHLPLYTVLHRPAARRPRRLFTLLGGTLAHLDHEPRFLQQCLLDCDVDDMLLLDVPLARAPCTDPTEIKRRDRLFAEGVPAPYTEWLAGPLWRHCPQVEQIECHWDLETQCPVPGSYALHAVATVKSSQRADRQFSLFRLGRYDPAQLTKCLSEIGWEELSAELYGGEHSLRLYLNINYNSSRRLSPMGTQRRTKAVGYVRVSSEQQVTEGVSLDAQRYKMRAYCKAMDIDLIDIIADEGYSASNLKRPGLRAALAMLRNGRASTLIVVKLDRLTRCVKDLGTLCEQYFSDEKPYTLLSLSDSINTRSASGKLVLNVLTSVAQWEREAIADRTKEAMAHLKRQGVKVGGVPYGWRYSSEVDTNGRRLIVKHPEEQKAIKRICALHLKQIPAPQIVQRLEQEGLPARGKRWHTRSVYQVLQRAGHLVREYRQDAPRIQPTVLELKRDKQAAAQRAMQLRAQRLSLRDIGAHLLGEGLLPARGGQWYAATVRDLLPRVASTPPAGAPGSTHALSKNLRNETELGRRPASRAAARPASERVGARALAKAEPGRKPAQGGVCERPTPTRPAAKSSSLPARRSAADARPRAQAG